MKMLEVFYIVLIFNFVLWLFGSVGISIVSDYNPLTPATLAWVGIPAFAGMLGGAAIISYFTKSQTTVQNVVYIFIGGIFWGAWGSAMSIFTAISAGIPELITMLAIFTAIMSVVFIMGMSQMVVGGFKSYD